MLQSAARLGSKSSEAVGSSGLQRPCLTAEDAEDGAGGKLVSAGIPETRYAKTPDGVHVAYQTVGDGPYDLIWTGGLFNTRS